MTFRSISLLLAASIAIPCAASAAGARVGATVTLNGDVGCGLVRSQFDRADAMHAAMQLQAAATQSPEAKKRYDQAVAHLTEVSNTQCRPLQGRFKVLEVRSAPEGRLLRVEISKYDGLWVWE